MSSEKSSAQQKGKAGRGGKTTSRLSAAARKEKETEIRNGVNTVIKNVTKVSGSLLEQFKKISFDDDVEDVCWDHEDDFDRLLTCPIEELGEIEIGESSKLEIKRVLIEHRTAREFNKRLYPVNFAPSEEVTEIFTGLMFMNKQTLRNSDLVKAIMNDDFKRFFYLFLMYMGEGRMNIFLVDKRGSNIFHLMAANNKKELLNNAVSFYQLWIPKERIVEYEKFVFEKLLFALNFERFTPIDVAAEEGNVECVELLLCNPAFWTYTQKPRFRPFPSFTFGNQLEPLACKLADHNLLKPGSQLVMTLAVGNQGNAASVYAQALCYSILKGHHNQFEMILEHLPTYIDKKSVFENEDWSITHYIVESGDLKYINYLTTKSIKDRLGYPAIVWAADLKESVFLAMKKALNPSIEDLRMLLDQLIVRGRTKFVMMILDEILAKYEINQWIELRKTEMPFRKALIIGNEKLLYAITNVYKNRVNAKNYKVIRDDLKSSSILLSLNNLTWRNDRKHRIYNLVFNIAGEFCEEITKKYKYSVVNA